MKDMISEPFIADVSVQEEGHRTFKIAQHTGAYVEVHLVPDMSPKDNAEFEALIENLADTLDTMVASGENGIGIGTGREGTSIWVEDHNEEGKSDD